MRRVGIAARQFEIEVTERFGHVTDGSVHAEQLLKDLRKHPGFVRSLETAPGRCRIGFSDVLLGPPGMKKDIGMIGLQQKLLY